MSTSEEDRRRAAAMRSYVTPALITLLLYFVFWLPGLIANIMYWQAASHDQRLTGVAPEGKKYLAILFIVFVGVPIAFFVLLLLLGFLSALIRGTA
ncbi:hypothetical protein [Nitrolancea hollandica]|uniref:Uncharacterized protein n=1 Tax=Nitrolancea hollandica Lb TaxID=1129897 RepID=I4EIX2_9BACT|nr:hypothetical protein [Nitrolancea hollandica]CCF84634.1 hypothetical protein NITHO_370006 [Nitrolancea hollandica Lb]